MRVRIKAGGAPRGKVRAIPSKSHVHRLLILAALADKETNIHMPKTKAVDIWATIRSLQALGAKITQVETGFHVCPIDRATLPQKAVLPVEESGSTLRFLLPIVAALGVEGEFHMVGRLPERPMDVLEDEMRKKGIRFWRDTPNVLSCTGQLQAGDYVLPGDISSQYVTGLLLALPLLGEKSHLTITGTVESKDYITLTLDAMAAFDFAPGTAGNTYHISHDASFTSPREIVAEGDWSNAAFWLCAGAMPNGEIHMDGLEEQSKQGDKEVVDILSKMGAKLQWSEGQLSATEGTRFGVEIDAIPIPDAIPVLSAVAAVGEGMTLVKNAVRLRIKESDRLNATATVLNTLGANVIEQEAGLTIHGVPHLTGGTVDSWGDHRIAMMAAIASFACTEDVVITNAEAVNKSYPTFWEELGQLGKQVVIEEDV